MDPFVCGGGRECQAIKNSFQVFKYLIIWIKIYLVSTSSSIPLLSLLVKQNLRFKESLIFLFTFSHTHSTRTTFNFFWNWGIEVLSRIRISGEPSWNSVFSETFNDGMMRGRLTLNSFPIMVMVWGMNWVLLAIVKSYFYEIPNIPAYLFLERWLFFSFFTLLADTDDYCGASLGLNRRSGAGKRPTISLPSQRNVDPDWSRTKDSPPPQQLHPQSDKGRRITSLLDSKRHTQ